MKVTLRTMDSGSEVFELPDETTVKGLKEKILSKMGIILDEQRLIFQGKVLKDEMLLQNYGVDGKVIHLVKRPPPEKAGELAGGGQGATNSATPTDGGGRGITVHASQDMVFVGNIPVSSRNDITQVTQNIVDQIVSSLSSHGAEAQVSAEAVTTDLSGATHTTTVSAKTGQNVESGATPPPPPPPHAAGASIRREGVLPNPPPPPPHGPRVTSSAQQRREPEAEQQQQHQRVESDRYQRQLRNIYSHSRSVKRCLQYATKVLDRYDRSVARVRGRERERESGEKERGEEKWETLEPMEVVEGGNDTREEPSEERYPELKQPSEDTESLSASLYVRFSDEIEALQRRVRPCIMEYRKKMDEDKTVNDDAVMDANRVALTIKDFNYYIGHAYVSLSRLHVNMSAPPPRTLRLTAPRRTEVRRMMQQFRPQPPGMGMGFGGGAGRDGPSGYIVDISRDDDSGGQGSERRSTRAVINRGGRGGGGRGGGGRGQPPGLGGGFPGFGGLFGGMGLMGSRRGGGDGSDGGDKEGGEAGREPEKGAEVKKEEPTSNGNGNGGGSGMKMEVAVEEGGALIEEEVRAKNEQEVEHDKQEVDKKEEVKSKNKVEEDEEVRSKSSQEKEEVKEEIKDTPSSSSAEPKTGDGDDDETPQYLARLLSELITGVADPAGPYRPTNKPKEGEEKPAEGVTVGGASSKGAASDKDVTTQPSESSVPGDGDGGASVDKEEGEGGEGGRRRTFAERYAGPEGTTVTISAAPVPPFGIPGLPPMEGPSVSIKNRGDGVEPEMTINFPVPPAIQLLQSLLERAEERHRQRREAGETSSEESESDSEDAEEEEEERKRREKRKELAKNRPDKAFLDEDGEIKSISDAGSLDSIHSDQEEDLPEFEILASQPGPSTTTPAVQSATPTGPSATPMVQSSDRVSMLDAMEEVRSQLAPNESRSGDNRNLGVMEDILKVISRELSVVEVMQVFQGNVGPAERLQPCLLRFVQDRLLNGEEATKERREEAVRAVLSGCKPALVGAECGFPLRDAGIDFPATVHHLLSQLCNEAYDHISKKENEVSTFGRSMKHWATNASGVFSNVIRHCVNGEELFEEMIEKLIGTLFPPNAPSMILDMCSGSILKEMVRVRASHPFSPQELDSYLHWKDGSTPTPNTSYLVGAYSMDQSTLHPGQMLPVPARESCPGGPNADDDGGGDYDRGVNNFPHGVPEEWVPSIKRDRESFSSLVGPQQPYSSAYLAGMPSKRRKQLDTSEPQSRSPEDLTFQLMEETLIETGARTITGKSQLEMLSLFHHDEALADAVTTDVYNIQRERCSSSPSFNKDKYPSCTKYYNIPPKDKQS